MFYSLLRGTRLSRLVLILLAIGSLYGCSRSSDKSNEDKEPSANINAVPVSAEMIADLHTPFSKATVDFGPPGSKRPPTTTVAGKDIGAIYEQIAGVKGKAGLWETIRFVSPAGKPICYQAVIKTDLGDIHLEFYPDKAPNHVRNFIALAKVGYYDGLAFDFINHSTVDAKPFSFVVAGCPLGTFEMGTNLGYWLKPEFSALTHDEGTVGAWLDAIPDGDPLESAGCKFYINVSKAPWMDRTFTIFGKVTQGLDVVRKISQAPLAVVEGGTTTPESGRPRQPVTIRSVVVEIKDEG